jgi:hypothetical protein
MAFVTIGDWASRDAHVRNMICVIENQDASHHYYLYIILTLPHLLTRTPLALVLVSMIASGDM